MQGKIYLIGCGAGSSDLLTMGALKAFTKLDVALIDALISDEVIAMLPKYVKIFYTGKRKAKKSIAQNDINQMALNFAKNGLIVGRLKCGDSYIFGRGAEEAIFAKENGIEVEVISGVSSSISASSASGISLTHRGLSNGFSVITAHRKDGKIDWEWIELLKIKNHTVVALMASSLTKEIASRAIERGVDKNLPVAVVSNATKANQKEWYGTLKDLYECEARFDSPATIIFGEVVNLHQYLPKFNQHQGFLTQQQNLHEGVLCQA